MVDFVANLAQLRQPLVEKYRRLDFLEQQILQLLSIIYEPISRSVLALCLTDIGVRNKNDRLFSSSTLKPYLDRFVEADLLVQVNNRDFQCHPLLIEVITRDAVSTGQFERCVRAAEDRFPISRRWKDGPRSFKSLEQFWREIRISIYRQNHKAIHQTFQDYAKYGYHSDIVPLEHIYFLVCNNPFDGDWFQTLSSGLQDEILISILNESMLELMPAQEAFAWLQANCATGKKCSNMQLFVLIEQLIVRGDLPGAQQAIAQLPEPYRSNSENLDGCLAFLRGENKAAIAYYKKALQTLKKGTGKRKVYFQSMSGLFFITALIKEGSTTCLQEAESYASIGRQANNWLSPIYSLLETVLQILQGDLAKKDTFIKSVLTTGESSLEILFRMLCLYWVDLDKAKSALPKVLEPFYQQAQVAGYDWLAMEAGELLAQLKPKSQFAKQTAEQRSRGINPLATLIQPQAPWELRLNALAKLYPDSATSTVTKLETGQRLVWFLTFLSHICLLQPREQTLNAKGEWSKGRPIALKRLRKPDDFSYLTPQDREICSHIKVIYADGYYASTDYVFGEKAIAALVGHPYVFWEDAPTTRVDVVKGEPELLVRKEKQNTLILQLSLEIPSNRQIWLVKETPTRLKVIEISAEHRRIAEILGSKNRLEVPIEAQDRVLAAVSSISSVLTVHSDIGGGATSAETIPADSKAHIHLLPAGEGLKVAVLTRPFAQGGPYYKPGTGGATVIAEIEGKRWQTTRDLAAERQHAAAIVDACPILDRYTPEEGEWVIEDPEDCLELLLELQPLTETAVVEWPEGEKLQVSRAVQLQDLQMQIKRQKDWFATDGELKVDDTLVLDMQRLMELLGQTSSRFIPLGDGQFLALTQEFRRRLDELRAISEKSGKGLRMHPLAAIAIDDWMEEVGKLTTDKHWKTHIQRLKESQTYEPTIPTTLQAELRDYQIDGFRWLARLAHWGVGACLADDMGLGKTLQALAVILTRAPEGSTLIIAPTSVCMNWISEAQRFAPTLNVLQFGSGDRQQLLDDLQPFDMLVCSYGLLQQEDVAEMLANVQWQTIVLDEAQSIKNFATKRSQAAMNLQGGFKLITTGTPIENHLGELWNLFRFINPGLLGSLEQFNQRFANPIERYQDKQARDRLKKLIQPFILRRTKSQVLQELPSRTEIVLQVELSAEELAFYEALRREAIAKLADSDAAGGAKHLQVLAEIMRLRRACCHTRLVKPEISLSSSKLQLFGEVLAELLENRHQALVFSQFVDHLQILREYLDQQQIPYQYLDGSTPAAERKKRVEAFQAGQGNVFLISLKAGGTGLNLTAADYVIHMDPWWNPAVEDQASDRAHRIGQQRPVTIYRLVAKNTIEEKIVDLHQHKRDLADSLLEGTDMSGKISTEELIRLIQTG